MNSCSRGIACSGPAAPQATQCGGHAARKVRHDPAAEGKVHTRLQSATSEALAPQLVSGSRIEAPGLQAVWLLTPVMARVYLQCSGGDTMQVTGSVF